jgi:hypothetical protein
VSKAAPILALGVLALVVSAASRPRKRKLRVASKTDLKLRETEQLLEEDIQDVPADVWVEEALPTVVSFGLELSDTAFEVVDWNAWMEWGPRAVREALDDGAVTGQQIASQLMRRVFPHRRWPPTPDDPLVHRWRLLVRGIERALTTTTPEEDDQSNVIQFHR